ISTFLAPRSAWRLRALLSARFHFPGSPSLTCITTLFAGVDADCANATEHTVATHSAHPSARSQCRGNMNSSLSDATIMRRPRIFALTLRRGCTVEYADACRARSHEGRAPHRRLGAVLHAARYDR